MNIHYHLQSDTTHCELASALYKYLIPMWVRKIVYEIVYIQFMSLLWAPYTT
jgi:hypothetical protein